MKSSIKTPTKRRMHPNSLANLEKGKQFQKGNKLSPGRPRNELSLTNLAREKLDEVCLYDPEGRTWKEYLVDRWLAHALDNVTYFRELTERLEGKILQPIGGEDGKPIKVEIDYKQKIISAISRHAARAGEDKGDPEP